MLSTNLRTARFAHVRNIERCDHLERRLRRYRPELREAVTALAQRDARLADLAASFPALLAILASPPRGFDPEPAIMRVIDGAGLAEIATAARVPMWLRKFEPEMIPRSVPKLPDSESFRRRIANHMPSSPKVAPVWLHAVAQTAEWGHEPLAIWCARELIRSPKSVKVSQLRLVSLWAWFSLQAGTHGHGMIERVWSPAMQFKPALTAAKKWGDAATLYVNLGSQPLEDMWLQPGNVGGYDFIPLRSIEDITNEAQAMENCLLTYGYSLVHNRSRLWTVRKDGKRVATLRIAYRFRDPLPNVFELKGAQNREAPAEVWWAARRWLHMQDLSKLSIEPIAWDAAPCDRKAWISLWRPYWLAKRRIPHWLPMSPSRDALDAL